MAEKEKSVAKRDRKFFSAVRSTKNQKDGASSGGKLDSALAVSVLVRPRGGEPNKPAEMKKHAPLTQSTVKKRLSASIVEKHHKAIVAKEREKSKAAAAQNAQTEKDALRQNERTSPQEVAKEKENEDETETGMVTEPQAKREEKSIQEEGAAALVLQKHWRGRAGRIIKAKEAQRQNLESKGKKENNQVEEEEGLQKAAVNVQKVWKGRSARLRYSSMKRASVVLQKHWRGRAARLHTKKVPRVCSAPSEPPLEHQEDWLEPEPELDSWCTRLYPPMSHEPEYSGDEIERKWRSQSQFIENPLSIFARESQRRDEAVKKQFQRALEIFHPPPPPRPLAVEKAKEKGAEQQMESAQKSLESHLSPKSAPMSSKYEPSVSADEVTYDMTDEEEGEDGSPREQFFLTSSFETKKSAKRLGVFRKQSSPSSLSQPPVGSRPPSSAAAMPPRRSFSAMSSRMDRVLATATQGLSDLASTLERSHVARQYMGSEVKLVHVRMGIGQLRSVLETAGE